MYIAKICLNSVPAGRISWH